MNSNPVKWPGLILLVAGILHVLLQLMSLFGGNQAWLDRMAEQNPNFDPSYYQGGSLFGSLLGMVVGGVVALGGWKMMNMQSWGLCIAAAVLSMIPCFGSCCGLTLPIGIWALVVLMKGEVKAAFQPRA